LVFNKCITFLIVENFPRHYLRNRSASDTHLFGYIDIIYKQERSPKGWKIPDGPPCILLVCNYNFNWWYTCQFSYVAIFVLLTCLQILVGARFSVPVQTGPAAHPPPCIRAYRLTYLGVKLSRRVVDHTVPSSAEVTPPPRLHVMLQVDISLSALVSLSVYFKWPSHYF